MCGRLSFSEAIIEEGEAEAEYSYCKDGENYFVQKQNKTNSFKMSFVADSEAGSLAENGQAKMERPRAHSSGSLDYSKVPAGGDVSSAGRMSLLIPVGPLIMQRRPLSPNYTCKQ